MKKKQSERLYPQRTKNFVAPDPPARKNERIDVLQEKMPQSLYAPVELKSIAQSEIDRALGFTIGTATLAGIVGLGAVLTAAVGWKVPLVSVTALTIFFVVAALVWLSAWTLHTLSSEGGIGLMSVLLQYRLLRHEQRARLERIRYLLEEEDE
jgi:hypothetical protein